MLQNKTHCELNEFKFRDSDQIIYIRQIYFFNFSKTLLGIDLQDNIR